CHSTDSSGLSKICSITNPDHSFRSIFRLDDRMTGFRSIPLATANVLSNIVEILNDSVENWYAKNIRITSRSDWLPTMDDSDDELAEILSLSALGTKTPLKKANIDQ